MTTYLGKKLVKLGDIIHLFDFLADICIWDNDNDEEPVYSGSIFDMPWRFLNTYIGRWDTENNTFDEKNDEPIFISINKETGNPVMIVNIVYSDTVEKAGGAK